MTIVTIRLTIQFKLVPTDWVRDLRVLDETSEATTQATGPQDQVKKKPNRQTKATTHLLAARLSGAAVAMTAKANMQNDSQTAPMSKMVLRPMKCIEGYMTKMPTS